MNVTSFEHLLVFFNEKLIKIQNSQQLQSADDEINGDIVVSEVAVWSMFRASTCTERVLS